VLINHVLSNTIRRSHVVFRAEIGEGPPEVFKKTLVLIRNGDPGRTRSQTPMNQTASTFKLPMPSHSPGTLAKVMGFLYF